MKAFSGIELTQVGDPLSHRQEGFIHCVSADRDVAGALSAVAVSKDEEVAELVFLSRDSTEGRGDSQFGAELDPHAEGVGLVSAIAAASGLGGDCERSAEISLEDVLGGR